MYDDDEFKPIEGQTFGYKKLIYIVGHHYYEVSKNKLVSREIPYCLINMANYHIKNTFGNE